MILDSELNFESHISEKLAKARKGLGVMKQLNKMGRYANFGKYLQALCKTSFGLW